jgi:hypothetical protein
MPDHEAHRCRNRWMMLSSKLDGQELRELGDLDEFLNSQ